MELTHTQQDWLEQLVVNGFVLAELSILNDKARIKVKSITGDEQLAVEKIMTGIEGSSAFIIHTYAIKQLAQVLKGYSSEKGPSATFAVPDEAEKFIAARSTVVIDAMVKAQTDFEKELKKLTTPEVLEENFSKSPGTDTGSNS